jgi:uncharacterized membrane protein
VKLSEAGESRIRGYLFVLGRALRTSLPRDLRADALKELESHIREQVDRAEAVPNEQAALERVLDELGHPMRVAQAYSTEVVVEEAVATGRASAVAAALWRLATIDVRGFFLALASATGYLAGLSCVLLAALKPLFPQNVGLFVVNGVPHSFGALFPAPAGSEVMGGLWLIPALLFAGLAILVFTHRCAQRSLSSWRAKREAAAPAIAPTP